MGNRIHMRAVQRASEIAQGVAPLAMYLDVSPGMVAAWIRGSSEVPGLVFLKIVEIVVDHAGDNLQGAIPPYLVHSFRHRVAANN